MRSLPTVNAFTKLVGEELGVSPAQPVTQEQITQFGVVTGDEQWIHLDVERAKDGPYGSTIAHGFLILSLLPLHANQVYEVEEPHTRINYGLNKVRFLTLLKAGAPLQNTVSVVGTEATATGLRVTLKHELRTEGADKPVCIAESITLFVPQAG